MSRFVTLFALVLGAGNAGADARPVVRGDHLPPGAVGRSGIPGEHLNGADSARLATADARPFEKGHNLLVWDVVSHLNR